MGRCASREMAAALRLLSRATFSGSEKIWKPCAEAIEAQCARPSGLHRFLRSERRLKAAGGY